MGGDEVGADAKEGAGGGLRVEIGVRATKVQKAWKVPKGEDRNEGKRGRGGHGGWKRGWG